MSAMTFNFHNLAGVKIETDDSGARQFFQAEYHPSEGSISQDLNIVNLRWKRDLRLRPTIPGYNFQLHKTLARWSYRIEIQESGVEIDALGNRIAIPMVHHMLVHPSLRFLAAYSNALMLHSSAVVVNNRSLVFTGTGGTGKTTISSLLLRHGGTEWKLHADDYTFLTKGPKSFSYMTRSHLYLDHLHWVPSIKSIITLPERVRLEFFGRLRQFTRDGIKLPLRVDASRLWPNHVVASSAALAGIVILGGERVNSPSLKQINPTERIIDELLEMNFIEARHFNKLMKRVLNEKVFDEWLENWKNIERNLIQKLLEETALFRLDLPHVESDVEEYGKQLVETLFPIFNDVGKVDFHD